MAEREFGYSRSREQQPQQEAPWLNLQGGVRYTEAQGTFLVLRLQGTRRGDPNSLVELPLNQNTPFNNRLNEFLGTQGKGGFGCFTFMRGDSIDLRFSMTEGKGKPRKTMTCSILA